MELQPFLVAGKDLGFSPVITKQPRWYLTSTAVLEDSSLICLLNRSIFNPPSSQYSRLFPVLSPGSLQ